MIPRSVFRGCVEPLRGTLRGRPAQRSRTRMHLALACLLVAARAGAQAPLCPKFDDVAASKTISPGDRVARFDGGVVALVKELRIDTDGSAFSYHPDNIGTTDLCNGMNPYVGGRCLGIGKSDLTSCFDAIKKAQATQWDRQSSPAFCVYGFEVESTTSVGEKRVWGGGHGSGPIPVQGPNDHAPGFFISTTAAPLPVKPGASRTTAYADADRIPYIVVPGSLVGHTGPTATRAAAGVVRAADLHAVAAIVADTGASLGEVSVAAAQMVQDPSLTQPVPITEQQLRSKTDLPFPYVVRKGHVRADDSPHSGPYLVFAFSKRFGVADEYSQAQAEALSKVAFDSVGGLEHISRCAAAHFAH